MFQGFIKKTSWLLPNYSLLAIGNSSLGINLDGIKYLLMCMKAQRGRDDIINKYYLYVVVVSHFNSWLSLWVWFFQ